MNEHDHDDQKHDQGQAAHQDDPVEIVTTTSDPAVEVGKVSDPGPLDPHQTLVAETSQVTHDVPIQVHLSNVKVDQPEPRNGEKSQDQGRDVDKSKTTKRQESSKNQEQPAHAARSGWLSLVLTGVLALVCGVGGAWAFSYWESRNKDQSKDASHAGKDKEKNSEDGSSKNDDSSSGFESKDQTVSKKDFDDLKQQVEQMNGLAARFSALEERFVSFNGLRNDTVRDISTLQVKMKEISKSIEDVADVPRRMQPLEGQVNRLQLAVDALSVQLAGRTTIKPIAEYPPVGDDKRRLDNTSAGSPPILAAPMVPASPNLPDATMDAAISFFKKGKYIQADEIFNDLQTSRAGDARVWYFSALAHGLSTGKWDGQTKRCVVIGAERERAGTPSASEIDSTFADLTVEQGKDWLASYRAQLVKR